MPRYQFDIKNSDGGLRHRYRQSLPNLAAAYQEAVLAIAGTAYEADPMKGAIDLSIWVTDEEHHAVLDLRMTFNQAAELASLGSRPN